MTDDYSLYFVLAGFQALESLPWIILSIVGLVLAGRRRADNPRAARLARIGCAVLLVAGVVSAYPYPGFVVLPEDVRYVLVAGILGLLKPVGVGLLIAAVVARPKASTGAPHPTPIAAEPSS